MKPELVPLREVAGEARRDVTSGTTRALLYAVAFALIVAGGSALAVSDQRRALAEAQSYRASGASVTLLRAEKRIDGDVCDAFARLPGVRAAGALRVAPSDIVPSVLPGSPLPTKQTTPGFPAVVRTSGPWREGGLILSQQAADAVGSTAGGALATTVGAATISGDFDFPDDGRQGDLGYSALVPQPPGDSVPYDECWVEVWPENEQITALLRTALRPGGADDQERPSTVQLNSRSGERFDGADEVDHGVGRLAPGGSAGAALIVGIIAVRLRRLELASARHAGVSPGAQALGLLLQSGAWILGGCLVASPVVFGLARTGDPTAWPALVEAGLVTMLAAMLGAVAGVVGTALLTRERYLFRYFKER